MTPEQRKALLIALATHVMGWKVKPDLVDDNSIPLLFPGPIVGSSWFKRWNPLESMDDAWMVVNALAPKGWSLYELKWRSDDVYACTFYNPNVPKPGAYGYKYATAKTAPEAICLAAADAVGVEVTHG